MFSEIDIKGLEIKKNKLFKKDIDLIVSDFDDTIFSTSEIIEKDIRKWRRWKEWNVYIREVIWIKNFIDAFYVGKNFPKKIISKLRQNHDLILTTWFEDIQSEKIKACKLDHINYRIVENHEDKILEMIKYIVEYLQFIPNKITVYEDKPKYYLDYISFLEDFFWIDIDIIQVSMINNNTEPKLKNREG